MSFLFKNLQPARSALEGSARRLRSAGRGRHDQGSVGQADQGGEGAASIDCGKRTLMPGLIDCHVHTHHSEVYINRMEAVPLTLMMARSAGRLKRMLDRGFTTVRDAGGADWGTKTAVESGLIPGPRMFISCRSIGPTGGHNDRNRRTDIGPPCLCCNGMVFIRCIADGPDEVRKAAREQMRQGADQVKLMVSGGVASPYDPLESLQFTDRGDHRRGRGGACLRPLRADPRLHARGDHPRRQVRRAHHRARQPGRRADRQADGAEGRLHGAQPGRPTTP